MTEKTFLALVQIFSIILTGIVALPVISYDVSLVTIPNRETFYLRERQPFDIICNVSGDDEMKFSSLKWLKQQGDVIPEGSPGTRKMEKNSLTLTFTDPKEHDSGVYSCVAVYENEQTLLKTVSIIFHSGKPYFDVDFANITVEENSFLEIPCIPNGESPITYEWYNQAEEKIKENSNAPIYVSYNGNGSTLIIHRVTLGHAGVYKCLAGNQHGLSSKNFVLTFLSSDGNSTLDNDTTTSFQNALVLSITARSVKFDFAVNGKVKYIEVLYGTKKNESQYFTKCESGDVCEIQDLIPAERYSFKFRTIPSDNGAWSKTYQVILLPDIPDVLFEKIDAGTVKFKLHIKSEDLKKATIDKHEISHFTVVELGGRWVPSGCRITHEIPVCHTKSYILSGLTYQTHEIQVRAHTASGYGEPYRQRISNWFN